MKCPACNHEAPAAEFGDPAKCPACGVYYEKAMAHRRRQEAAAAAPELENPQEPGVGDKLKRGFAGARESVEAGRKERQDAAAAVKRAMTDYRGAQPVVVLDINMSFGSMVVFMIKWALAAIPALFILVFIGFFALIFLGGLAGISR